MKSYRFDAFTSLEDLRMLEEEMPRPQRGELLLRGRAVSLNYRDVAMVLGRYPSPSEPGHVPSSDGAAEVMEVGDGVVAYKAGDRVIGLFHPRWYGGERPSTLELDSYGAKQDGWLTEYKVVSQEAVLPLPEDLSFEEGATLPCAAATAWCALSGPSPVRAGQTVLTQGTGGVSIFAVQLAKALGARVIATTSSPGKAERLRAFGADEIINYRDTSDWGARARALTQGWGVDRIVEVGGAATINQSLEAIACDGEIVLIGFLSSNNPGLDYFDLQGSYARLRSITVGDRENLRETARAISVCGIRPVIDRVFDFGDAKAAFAHLEAGRHVGKIVIRVGE